MMMAENEDLVVSPVNVWRGTMKKFAKSGSWYCSGETFLPCMSVAGEMLRFPLSTKACEDLIAQAAQAPFGKGMETVVDTQVRQAWQIEAGALSFGVHWNTVLNNLVSELKNSFQRENISLELYKMLIYKEGGHFCAHLDTQRSENHMASLLISLPVEGGFEGGQLEIHGPGALKVSKVHWQGQSSNINASFCSFYTDCEHELKPVTAGHRVTLAYLVRSQCEIKPSRKREYFSPIVEVEDTEDASTSSVSVPVHTIVDRVLEHRPHACILLNHGYGSNVELKYLKGADRLVMEHLLAHYSAGRIQLHQMEINYQFTYDGNYEDHDYIHHPVARMVIKTGSGIVDNIYVSHEEVFSDELGTMDPFKDCVGDRQDECLKSDIMENHHMYFSHPSIGFLFGARDLAALPIWDVGKGAGYSGNEAATEENIYHQTVVTIARDDDGHGSQPTPQATTAPGDDEDSTATASASAATAAAAAAAAVSAPVSVSASAAAGATASREYPRPNWQVRNA